MTGCAKTVAKTVKVDSFCEGKYYNLWLESKDLDNLEELYINTKYNSTIKKYIDYHTINEKEYKICNDNIN